MEPNPPSSSYFVREANSQAVVVSILGKFTSQESFKSISITSNDSNNDSEQENRREPNFIPPVVNSDNETERKERFKARDSPEEPA